MAVAVLDASAVTALLLSEPGHELVVPLLGQAAISAVNVQEVFKVLGKRGLSAKQARSAVTVLELEIVSHDIDEAARAANLVSHTEKYGSGIGDRSCMALAMHLGLAAYTADKAWSKVNLPGLTIVVIR